MKKEEFVSKQVTFINDDMVVTRLRTSAGAASISIKIGTQHIILNGDNAGTYEQRARDLAELLEAAANDTCNIVKV